MLFLTLLAACGEGGKGSVQLEISQGFATGNSQFDGGLYIHGKKVGSTEEFSFALVSEQRASLKLSFGQWDIRAVGWDDSAQVFEGKTLCAYEKVNFQSNNRLRSCSGR